MLVLAPAAARADDALQVGGHVGWAFPAGALERGSRTSDLTFGTPLFGFDVVQRVSPRIGLGAAFSYGVVIPTLCAASDCTSSLGRDVALTVVGRFAVAEWRKVEAGIDVGVGYEWLSTKLSDSGTTSRRTYRGFAGQLDADLLLRVSAHVRLGPRLELRGGNFHRVSLDAPGIDASGPTEGTTFHLWPAIAFRVTGSFG